MNKIQELILARKIRLEKERKHGGAQLVLDFSFLRPLAEKGLIMQAIRCPHCGGKIEEIPSSSDFFKCHYCGNIARAVDIYREINRLLGHAVARAKTLTLRSINTGLGDMGLNMGLNRRGLIGAFLLLSLTGTLQIALLAPQLRTAVGQCAEGSQISGISSMGNLSIEWQKTYGGEGWDSINHIIQTKDGGFLLVGSTSSYGGNGNGWLIKIDASGDVEWNKTYAGSTSSAVETDDGGYAVVGEISDGGQDILFFKTDSGGNVEVNKTFSGAEAYSEAHCVTENSDGGFTLVGNTFSHGNVDDMALVIRIDSSGNVLWTKTYGGKYAHILHSGMQADDGGFVFIGGIGSYNQYDPKDFEAWLVRTDTAGNMEWNRTYGEGGYNYIAEDMIRTDARATVTGCQIQLREGSAHLDGNPARSASA